MILRPVHRAHRESREVELSPGVDRRHLRGLSPEQRAAGLPAPFRDARDDLGAVFGRKLPGGVVVEEEERLGAVDEDVVDAHGDEVDPHRVELPGRRGDLDLGPHAVGARDEDRVAVLPRGEAEEARERADLPQDLLAVRRADHRPDPANEALPLVDVDAGGSVRDGFFQDALRMECTPR